MIEEKFGKIVSKARSSKSITQDMLAQELHVCRQTISRWECGLSIPDMPMIIKTLKILEVDINTLFITDAQTD